MDHQGIPHKISLFPVQIFNPTFNIKTANDEKLT